MSGDTESVDVDGLSVRQLVRWFVNPAIGCFDWTWPHGLASFQAILGLLCCIFRTPLCQNDISPLLQACKSPGNLALRMRGGVVWEGILQEVLKELMVMRRKVGQPLVDCKLFRHSEKQSEFSNVPFATIYEMF
jgi:hypothetical protein